MKETRPKARPKDHIIYDPIYMKSQKRKTQRNRSRLVVARAWGRKELANGHEVNFEGN